MLPNISPVVRMSETDSNRSNNGSLFPRIPEGESLLLLPIRNIINSVSFIFYKSEVKQISFRDRLFRYPETLLGNPVSRAPFWNERTGEYFFDRHRASFESILYIYQSNGVVKRPETVPIDIFLKEMKFFQMTDELVEAFWINEGYEKPEETKMPQNIYQRRLWELMEYPDSSLSARILAFISIVVITTSIVSFCLETLPALKPAADIDGVRDWSNPFLWIELICIIWFTIELLLRFASCPCKIVFMRSFLNIIDFVAIAPFFVNLLWSDASKSNSSMSFAVLRVLRLVRVFRIFKLSRHSVGLQILGKTFRASVQEFCLLIFFMAIALVLFSSGVYFAEQSEPDTKFTSIPASFWFVLVTMTTVGYGDLTPTGVYGKLVGSMCALIGVLTLALPVPIIVSISHLSLKLIHSVSVFEIQAVNMMTTKTIVPFVANFKHFYRQETRLATMRINVVDKMDELDDEESDEDDEIINGDREEMLDNNNLQGATVQQQQQQERCNAIFEPLTQVHVQTAPSQAPANANNISPSVATKSSTLNAPTISTSNASCLTATTMNTISISTPA
ncbi:unnamed protein product [Anisakis simplex]|uniref:Potassium voltage-gated channel protein shk-1 (inferred by orthology to a C. elegans protein) n=1 Tax=Anisakis simplex TaxID=6269 RepID=A0A158PNP3_ANISI|nr:unnamed protein product [Anisakis simplex]